MLNKKSCYPESGSYGRNMIKVELDLSNNATKSDLKGAAGIDKSQLAKKIDLGNIKSDVDRWDALESILVDLSKLSKVVKNDVVEKTVYDELVIQIIHSSNLVKKLSTRRIIVEKLLNIKFLIMILLLIILILRHSIWGKI